MLGRLLLAVAIMWASAVSAQSPVPPAQLDMAESGVAEGWFGASELSISLSRGVPFRVFTLDAPRRLVVDFQGLDDAAFADAAFVQEDAAIAAARMGRFATGWTRFIADLSGPYSTDDIAMQINDKTGAAVLRLTLSPSDPEAFSAQAGTPPGARQVAAVPVPRTTQSDAGFVVVIDPGHGGVDPGAERDGVSEKQLMLAFAKQLAAELGQMPDVQVYLTREADVFVSLDARVALAQAVHADIFLSLHADALSEGGAEGATVYTLAEEASDAATAQLAARHNRADVIAGTDLTHTDDETTRVLLDLARRETEPRSRALAQAIVTVLDARDIPINRRPLRQAGFAVLKSADVPSVLVEVGFLSSARDLNNLSDPAWQKTMIDALAAALGHWREIDERRTALLAR
ncbi:MAG: N-acetylmuramoyl-L-alanine amidase [Pseudomonadota bacterium]